jgi:hypothetical protein
MHLSYGNLIFRREKRLMTDYTRYFWQRTRQPRRSNYALFKPLKKPTLYFGGLGDEVEEEIC